MIINGKIFNPGEMRTKIVLAKRTITQDAGGFQKPGEEFVAEVWSKWINVHGQEIWAAEARGAVKAATLMIRYRDDIDETCLVVKGATVAEVINDEDILIGFTFSSGEHFEIISMDNIQEKNEFIELKVKLLKVG